MTRAHWLITAIALGFATAAQAQDEPQCMASVPITQDLVSDAAENFSGYAAQAALPGFLIGHLSPSRDRENAHEIAGAIVFVQSADGWRAFLPSPGESVVAAFTAAGSGAVVLVTQWQSEGPGQSWTLLRSADALASGACTLVPFPETLNQPTWANEFLGLADFDIDAQGRGEIIGTANVERDGEQKSFWYRYRTRDNGATWSAPARVFVAKNARAGIYTRLVDDATPPPALVQSLRTYANGR